MSEQREISIVDRLRFDATRCELQFSKGVAANISEAADEIETLRAQLEGCKEMFAHTAERANEYVKAFQQQERRLASARKALEEITRLDAYHDLPHARLIAEAALTDEEGKS